MSDFLDVIAKAASFSAHKASAEAGQVTLGELVARLEGADQSKPVKFDNGKSPGHFNSYRGYYDMVAISRGKKCSVGQFLKLAKEAIGGTFTGYKGSEFTMTKMTPVWVSEYGMSSGIGVTDIDTSGDMVILKTAVIDP